MKLHFIAAIVALLAVASGAPAPAAAQSADTFTARLGWVPTTPRERPNVTGKGSATGRLAGSTLTITGSFEGLAAPATVARLHRGVTVGARGPAIADLVVTKADNGTLSGSVTLDREQVDALRKGQLYIQLHSEKGVEDGSTLWGWFLRP